MFREAAFWIKMDLSGDGVSISDDKCSLSPYLVCILSVMTILVHYMWPWRVLNVWYTVLSCPVVTFLCADELWSTWQIHSKTGVFTECLVTSSGLCWWPGALVPQTIRTPPLAFTRVYINTLSSNPKHPQNPSVSWPYLVTPMNDMMSGYFRGLDTTRP